MKVRRIMALVLALAVCLCQAALAEDTYVNLEERFGDVVTYEYDGVTQYLKNRVSTTLVMCANPSQTEGAGSAELILLLPVDDDAKFCSPVQLETAMAAQWLEGGEAEKTLGELFGAAESMEAGCVKLMEAINALFPSAMIEHYALLDLRGLPELDGIANDEVNVTGEALVDRLKAIKNMTEQDPKADLNGMLSALSGYIITDMKSGAMIKLVDKVDRYDRASRAPFPVLEPADAEAEKLHPDMDAFEAMMVDIFFTETRAW